jgi:hypothetical protein
MSSRNEALGGNVSLFLTWADASGLMTKRALLETPAGPRQQPQLIEDLLLGELLGATEDVHLGAPKL